MSIRLNNNKPAAAGSKSSLGCCLIPVAVMVFAILAAILLGVLVVFFRAGGGPRGHAHVHAPATAPAYADPSSPPPAAVNPLQQALEPPDGVARKDGIGVAVLVDVSGSMNAGVPDADGHRRPKIAIARRSVLNLLGQCDKFARENPARNIQVGVYEFSSRDRELPCRVVIPIGPLDLDAARAAVERMRPNGNTPIGDALIQAKMDLDLTGLTRLHVLVVTDGENNQGYAPTDVVNAMMALPDEHRASVYFIAFDIAAERFNSVRDAGGLVLAASNETELQQTLDYVLTGKILAEQPQAVPGK